MRPQVNRAQSAGSPAPASWVRMRPQVNRAQSVVRLRRGVGCACAPKVNRAQSACSPAPGSWVRMRPQVNRAQSACSPAPGSWVRTRPTGQPRPERGFACAGELGAHAPEMGALFRTVRGHARIRAGDSRLGRRALIPSARARERARHHAVALRALGLIQPQVPSLEPALALFTGISEATPTLTVTRTSASTELEASVRRNSWATSRASQSSGSPSKTTNSSPRCERPGPTGATPRAHSAHKARRGRTVGPRWRFGARLPDRV